MRAAISRSSVLPGSVRKRRTSVAPCGTGAPTGTSTRSVGPADDVLHVGPDAADHLAHGGHVGRRCVDAHPGAGGCVCQPELDVDHHARADAEHLRQRQPGAHVVQLDLGGQHQTRRGGVDGFQRQPGRGARQQRAERSADPGPRFARVDDRHGVRRRRPVSAAGPAIHQTGVGEQLERGAHGVAMRAGLAGQRSQRGQAERRRPRRRARPRRRRPGAASGRSASRVRARRRRGAAGRPRSSASPRRAG